MSEGANVTGGCLCGAVRYTATPKNHSVAACHCGMCQRWSGGVFFAIECGDKVSFESDEYIGVYPSSDWGERGFCKKCGSSLFWKMRDKDEYMLSPASLDDKSGFNLDHEIFIEDKPGYFSFAGDLTKMTGEEVFAHFAEQNKENQEER